LLTILENEPLLRPKERDDHAKDKVSEALRLATTSAKENKTIQISSGGLQRFKNWYNSRRTHSDPFLASFEAREDDHTLRLAACLAINDGTLEIQARHISTAIKIIHQVKNQANGLFGGDFSQRARITSGITRLREILIEAGSDGIKHSDVQRRIVRRMDAKELRLLINIMHECGMIQIFKLKRGQMYRATRAIEKFGVTSEVLAKLNLPE